MDLKKPFDTIKDEFLDDAAFLILRLGLGFGMAFGHGWGKLMKRLNRRCVAVLGSRLRIRLFRSLIQSVLLLRWDQALTSVV